MTAAHRRATRSGFHGPTPSRSAATAPPRPRRHRQVDVVTDTASSRVPCVHRTSTGMSTTVYGGHVCRQDRRRRRGHDHREPDTRRRLTGSSADSPAGHGDPEPGYEYDLVGNVTEHAEQRPAPDVPQPVRRTDEQNYTYDGRYRITRSNGTWDYEPKTTAIVTWAVRARRADEQRDSISPARLDRRHLVQEQLHGGRAARPHLRQDASITYNPAAEPCDDVVDAAASRGLRRTSYNSDGDATPPGSDTATAIRKSAGTPTAR